MLAMYFRSSFFRYIKKVTFSPKCYCTRAKPEEAYLDIESHMFNQPGFTNYTELSQLLKNNIIYFKNGLLVVNKPYGLQKENPLESLDGTKKRRITKTPCSQKIDHLSLSGVLGRLSNELNTPDLSILKTPDRYISGVSLLHYDDQVVKPVRKAFMPVHIPIFTYLVVCIGTPIESTDSSRLGVTMKTKDKSSRVVFLTTYSKRSVYAGKVYAVVMKHKLLAANEELGVSLIELKNNRNKWNSLRAYCASRLAAPILGDNIYGSCAKTLNGVKIAVDPFSPAASVPQKIPRNILNALDLQPKHQSLIPLHLHLAQLDLNKYKKLNGLLMAKPSDHFLWTCEKLGLSIPEYYMTNRVISQSGTSISESVVDAVIADEMEQEDETGDDVSEQLNMSDNVLEHVDDELRPQYDPVKSKKSS